MIFKHFGNPNNPAVILLHGGGLSWWMWEPVIDALEPHYHLVIPVIDGHDIDEKPFVSIADSADQLLTYISQNIGSRIFALCGFSLGAQIALEALAQQPSFADYALIESAMTEPMAISAWFTEPAIKLSYGLISKRWFARAQAKEMFIPESAFETYFQSSQRISKNSLIQIMRSNAAFRIDSALSQCSAKTLILAGQREISGIKKSAEHLAQTIPKSQVRLLPEYRHGQLCIQNPDTYVQIFKEWVNN